VLGHIYALTKVIAPNSVVYCCSTRLQKSRAPSQMKNFALIKSAKGSFTWPYMAALYCVSIPLSIQIFKNLLLSQLINKIAVNAQLISGCKTSEQIMANRAFF
jgi:hypothetical protein